MDWGYLLMLGIVAVGVFTLSYRFVRHRSYCSKLEWLGFASCPHPVRGRVPSFPAVESQGRERPPRKALYRRVE